MKEKAFWIKQKEDWQPVRTEKSRKKIMRVFKGTALGLVTSAYLFAMLFDLPNWFIFDVTVLAAVALHGYFVQYELLLFHHGDENDESDQ